MVIFFIKFCILLLALSLLTIHYIKKKSSVCYNVTINPPPISKKWFSAIFILCIFLYFLFVYIIYLSWIKADEWIFIRIHDAATYKQVIETSSHRWFYWNSRVGELLGSIIGLSLNRWQHIYLTPIFIIGAPFSSFLLVRPKRMKTPFNATGFFFILFFMAIMAISVCTTSWRNYYDYAAAVNYLWPCTVICFFLSFYRSEFWTKRSNSKSFTVLVGVLGVFSGWAIECVTAVLLPMLLIWLFYRYKKNLCIPQSCFAGICGFIIGSFMLFGTHGHDIRGAGELVNSTLNLSSLSFSEAFQFACDHSSENMSQIKGKTIDFYLKDLPLVFRFFYFPVIMKLFISCCYPVLIFIFVSLIAVWTTPSLKRKKTIYISGVIILLSIASTSSYLFGGIPRKMSYYPCSFMLVVACSYLYLRLYKKHPMMCITFSIMAVLSFSISVFPSVIEAREYKHYEYGLRDVMYENMRKDVKEYYIHPPTFSSSPKNKLGLISDSKHVW